MNKEVKILVKIKFQEIEERTNDEIVSFFKDAINYELSKLKEYAELISYNTEIVA